MKKIKTILLFCVALAMTGCNDFIDLSPISQASENNFYKTQSDMETAMNSVYNTLYDIYGPSCLPSYFGEAASDNAYCNETAYEFGAKIAIAEHKNVNTDNAMVLDFWNYYYKALFKINNVISKCNGSDIPNKDQIIGECRFLRALYYFDLVRAYGDVPLVLEPVDAAEAYKMGRTPSSEIYNAIVEDLKFAADNLPAKTNERFTGAATSDAANTLLGKVYLTMGDKQNAQTVLLKEYGKFTLVPNYKDLWDNTKKNSSESIFEVQYKGGKSNPYSLYFAIFSPRDNYGISSWGMGGNQVLANLVSEFEAGDKRLDASIRQGYLDASGTMMPDKWYIKWWDQGAELNGRTEAGASNFIILRYSDVLLMLTEATGDPKYMNEVRARAGLPAYGTAGYPSRYTTVDQAVQHEERVEFCGEFHRTFDLLRYGNAYQKINAVKGSTMTSDAQMLLPIPQSVIDQNPDVITQNEAYK